MSRIRLLQDEMKRKNVELILVSDLTSIYYLIDRKIPHSKWLCCLLVPQNGSPHLFKFEIYKVESSSEFVTVDFDQNTVGIHILSQYINTPALHVDGKWPVGFLFELQEQKPNLTIKIDRLVDEMRSRKDEHERLLLRESSRICDQVLTNLRPLLQIGVSEREIHDEIIRLLKELGAEGVSFDPIVTFGENVSKTHSTSYKRLMRGDSVLLDFGAKYQGYCSDVTRFFTFRENKKARKLYEIVKRASEVAIATIRPGVPMKDIHHAANQVIREAGYGGNSFYPTGHGIGLGVHELFYVSHTSDWILQEGMCFSIEPGIYRVDGEASRVEDLVIVTKEGCEVLNHYPKDDIFLD